MSPGVTDWVVTGGVTVVLLVVGVSTGHSAVGAGLPGYALLALSGLVLVLRRRAPVMVLAVTGACAVGYQAVGFDVPAVAFLFAVYAVVRAGHRVVAVIGSVVVLAALPLAILASPDDWAVGEAFAHARRALEIAWLVAAGAAGEALRQAERRAEEAERTREEVARRRADEERLHIARELHDSLIHQISIIKVQAEAVVHVARRRGEPVPAAVLAIQKAGREANRELRATLEALRDDGTSPPRGLGDVPELVADARGTGLAVELTTTGIRCEVPAAVDRTAYRIVQESLTNVNRHAGASGASVRIDYRTDALVVRVEDDGRATPDVVVTPGAGLLGMRERITALGGSLRAGPRDGGGFSVRAELPVRHG
ncbi:signal transduction histidine kinase [Stackebrandtia albiflava]|uniref:histidine kinase n=2 Tax=Stackebrandtia albiflava TaxID=406432 RepID=A0A562VCF8_9ACTN|nr:signal transduction histidine kinase [Stackebrandtia albiflava]